MELSSRLCLQSLVFFNVLNCVYVFFPLVASKELNSKYAHLQLNKCQATSKKVKKK